MSLAQLIHVFEGIQSLIIKVNDDDLDDSGY